MEPYQIYQRGFSNAESGIQLSETDFNREVMGGGDAVEMAPPEFVPAHNENGVLEGGSYSPSSLGIADGSEIAAEEALGPPVDNMGPPDHNMQVGDDYVEGYTNYAPADLTQTGGDGFRLGVDAEMVGGQAVVDGYDSEQATCGGYGGELSPQEGGGSPFNFIIDPDSGTSLSIFGVAGKALLKRYVKAYKRMQSGGGCCTKKDSRTQHGGTALLEGVDETATGALYDGVQNAGAESLPGACDVTYDAAGPEWTHTQVGGGKKYKKRHSKSKGRVMKKRPCGCNKGCKSCKTYGCDKDHSKCKCEIS